MALSARIDSLRPIARSLVSIGCVGNHRLAANLWQRCPRYFSVRAKPVTSAICQFHHQHTCKSKGQTLVGVPSASSCHFTLAKHISFLSDSTSDVDVTVGGCNHGNKRGAHSDSKVSSSVLYKGELDFVEVDLNLDERFKDVMELHKNIVTRDMDINAFQLVSVQMVHVDIKHVTADTYM